MPSSLHLVALPHPDRHRAARRQRGLLYPLDVTYRRAGLETPGARAISSGSIPSPYRELLIHEHSMTATLERHFGVPMILRPMFAWSRGRTYIRRVVLARQDSGRPVEMGAIHLNLEALSRRVRTLILRHEIPIGRILDNGSARYCSRPRKFLEVTPNSEMLSVFGMREPRTLYGRQTDITLDGRPIGGVVEILPLF